MTPSPVVLVVEDEPSVQATLCATLTLTGFRTHHADNVDAALTILGTAHVDAVVLDIRLADPTGFQRSGLTLLAHLRSTPEYASIPALIFTGMPLSSHDEEFVQLHHAHVFHKPERYSVLIERLHQLLQHSAPHSDSANPPRN